MSLYENYEYLYPEITDPNFNIKIAERKEFNDNNYDVTVNDAEQEAERLCNSSFELSPHQIFVKNFLSINTPYNSLLLYHGLGTGKTCSAIGISEEMRAYMKQMNITKRIIVVASPNVQENFRLQLFDDRKLKKVNNIWNIEACSGSKYLKEINPINLKDLSKAKIISQVKKIINSFYLFMGYVEFSNYILKTSNIPDDLDEETAERVRNKKLESVFSNRLIIIDEVHNIRISEDSKQKRVATNLMTLVEKVSGIRLLLLSATPMYNNYKEIVWLINLMNANDKRSLITHKEIFDNNDNFLIDEDGNNVGEELLLRKATGYVSFVRGDNPYTFPYRIYPNFFDPEKSLLTKEYPLIGINKKQIVQKMEYLDLYCIKLGEYQNTIYEKIIESIKEKSKSDKSDLPSFDNMDKFGYTMLQEPLEALNIVYPETGEESTKVNTKSLVGKEGLNNVMSWKESMSPPEKYDYDYRPDVLKKYGKIFTKENIGKYSSKIKSICDHIFNSEGIILVYSQYLDGGLIPLALALEELGFKKHDTKSLLKNPSIKLSKPLSYVMITGNKMISPNNIKHVKAVSSDDNLDGSKIKVVLISKAGSEGLDFKNIRQIHILEPWYNTNRIEQIIGRGVRTCSHINMPFLQRNVMIFLYGTLLENKNEAVDMYIYRVAELKAIQIGKVSRVLKQGAVDCLLNKQQGLFSENSLNQVYDLQLSNKKVISYKIGDKSFSQLCDYMDKCDYVCKPNKDIKEDDVKNYTYDELFIQENEKIKKKIKNLFKEHYFYKKSDLIRLVTLQKSYPLIQIYGALNDIIQDKNEYLVDKYDRIGFLVNIEDYYLFQPNELQNVNISQFDRSHPIDLKRSKLLLSIKKKEKKPVESKSLINDLLKNMKTNYEKTMNPVKIKRADYDWYKHCAYSILKLEKAGIEKSLLLSFVIAHQVDFLSFNDKLQLINYLFFKDGLTDFEKKIKKYIESRLITSKGISGIFLQKENKHVLYVLKNKEKEWKEAEETDYTDLSGEIKKNITDIIKNLNDIVGFIINFKGTFMVFKTKYITIKRNKGARCDQASKTDTVKLLNSILKKNRFDEKTIKEINSVELCCFLEFLLRYYDLKNVDGKKWFIKPEYSLIVNIEGYNK